MGMKTKHPTPVMLVIYPKSLESTLPTQARQCGHLVSYDPHKDNPEGQADFSLSCPPGKYLPTCSLSHEAWEQQGEASHYREGRGIWVGWGWIESQAKCRCVPCETSSSHPHLGRLQSDLAFLVMINASQCNVHQKRHSLFSTRQFPQISICVSADQSGVNSLTPGRPDTCLTTAPACTLTPWR